MQSESSRSEMTCPMNGELCTDGVRPDFKLNAQGIKKPCRWWTQVAGKDPQSEKIIDHFDCSMAWMPVVGLEQSQMTRHNTATIQEFRNENHDAMEKWNRSIEKAAGALEVMAEQQAAAIADQRRGVIEFKANGETHEG